MISYKERDIGYLKSSVMGSSMSQEIKADFEEKSRKESEEMCMKQMEEVMEAINEASTVITERYVQLLPWAREKYSDSEEEANAAVQALDAELRKLYVVTHRVQQLECMLKETVEKGE